MFSFLCVGCSKTEQSHTIIFKDDIEIDYRKNENTARYVERVDSFIVDGSMIEKNKIHVSNFTVECPSLKADTLGMEVLIYRIGNEEYPLKVKVVDRIKPVIKVKEVMEFEVGQMKEIEEYYSVSDNFDEDTKINVKIKNMDTLDINKVGEYELTIIAVDTSKNEASKKVHIKIKDSKKEEEERKKKEAEEKREKEQQIKQEQSEASHSNSDTLKQPTPSAPVQPQRPAYSSKDFLFSQGYDMSTAPSACQQELLASGMAGACVPLQDAEGIYYGMRLTFY